MKVHLNKAFVSRIKCEESKSKQEFNDIQMIGFFLEFRKNGKKKYFLITKNSNGKIVWVKVGDAKIIKLEDARAKAIKLKRKVESQVDNLTLEAENSGQTMTLVEFYNDHYLTYIKMHIKLYETNISVFKNHILPAFGLKNMVEIKKSEIITLHSNMVQIKKLVPATANRVLIFISHAFNVAMQLEIKGIEVNPASKIKPYLLNNARERYLTKDEATRLIDAINQTEQNIHLKYIIPMLILTGARRGEVLKATHEDFNLNQMTWTIPTSKSGKKRILPITPQLLELYKSIPKDDTPYLFASAKSKKPYVTIYVSWNSARTRAGLKDLRMHDLRHSFASALVNNGRSLYEVQTLLGHSTSKMTQRYAHLSNENLMKAASCAETLVV